MVLIMLSPIKMVLRFGQLSNFGFPKSFPFWKIRFGCKGTKNLRNATLFHKKKVIKIVNRLCFIESDDESRARTSFIYNKIKQTTKVSMNNSKYRGVVVPMVTPVTQDGRLDVEAVKRIINFFADNKVSPLLMGTTGEGNSISLADGQLLVETAVKARDEWAMENDQCSSSYVQRSTSNVQRIYAGLTGNCFAEQVRQAEIYTALGADVIVATLPTYYALTEEQMYEYYKTLADCITGPLMLYNILATTHMSIPVAVIRRLANHPNIVGLKDSERDSERMAQCIEIAKGRDDFAYFCGWAAQSAHALELGGNGIVPSTGNYVPDMFQQLYSAAIAGDMTTANRLQDETNEIAKIYQKDRTLGQSLTALKVMMCTKGLCEPWMLMPLTRLSTDEEQTIKDKVNALG